jgi:peptidoglycan/xylan/chitin deacetylase (PgdA/CDA1 family)
MAIPRSATVYDTTMQHSPVNLGRLQHKKIACLTLDVEHDFGTLSTCPAFFGLGNIPTLVDFLKEKNIPLTCYIQGSLLEDHGKDITYLSRLDAEFEPHSFSHPGPETMNFVWEITRSKEAYSAFFKKDPLGYRSPDGYIADEHYFETLVRNGFRYDSSVFPSFRPGRFNHLNLPVTPYYVQNRQMIEFPFSVLSPHARIPLSLSYMKLFGSPFRKLMDLLPLPDLINFDFHLHDLTSLPSFDGIYRRNDLPAYQKALYKRIYKSKGDMGFCILDGFITSLLESGYEFLTIEDIYRAATA